MIRHKKKTCVSRTMDNNGVAITVPEAKQFQAVAAFSLRTGGQSPRPLDSLNLSVSQGDSPENVSRNLSVFCASVGIRPDSIVTCKQVHEDTIAVVDAAPSPVPEADAIISIQPGIFPGVKTADCLPVLLLDPINRISAAIHAGWRGTVLNITGKTVRFMVKQFFADPGKLVAILGPAIGPCCYEVDDTVLVPFRKHVPDAELFIREENRTGAAASTGRKSYRVDLEGANRRELAIRGIPEGNIHASGLCTCCNPHLFFSYRRDGARSGRHLAVVGFRKSVEASKKPCG